MSKSNAVATNRSNVECLEGRSLMSVSVLNGGELTVAKSFSGAMRNPGDIVDYRFHLSSPGYLAASASGVGSGRGSLTVLNAAGSPLSAYTYSGTAGPKFDRISSESSLGRLPAGDYVLQLRQNRSSPGAGSFSAKLAVDFAGETPSDARSAGTLTSGKSFTEHVGGVSDLYTKDAVDLYKFDAPTARSFQANVNSATLHGNVQILQDTNGDGVLDALTGKVSGSHAFSASAKVKAGAVYVRVARSLTAGDYTLGISNVVASPAPAPTPSPTPVGLAAPSGLRAVNVWAGAVDLNWTDNSASEMGTRVEINRGGGWEVYADYSGANRTSARVSNLSPGHTYQFGVRAFNGTTYSALSGVLSVTTKPS